jgi:hypothetical protein
MRIKIVAAVLVMSSSVWAEDAAVCRPYARLATDNIIREVWQRAYNYCMNLEEGGAPRPPETWKDMMEVFNPKPPAPVSRPVHKVDEVPPGEAPASGPIDEKPAAKKKTVVEKSAVAAVKTSRVGKSGFAKGSGDWNAYCKKNWPASFDAKTGTIIKRCHKRIPCPG